MCWGVDPWQGVRVHVADFIFYAVPFVFLGLCLLYVRAADRL
jgi:hypothetical protein